MQLADSFIVNFGCKHKQPDYILYNLINDLHWCNVIEYLTIKYDNVELNAVNVTDNNRIEGFVAENMEIFHFPKRIDDHFPNLNTLIIKNCSLKAITSKNLKNFKLLQNLDLSYNEVEVLEEKVFYSDFTLLHIILNNNRIKHIHPLAFKPLGLNYLDLENNECILEKAVDSKAVEELLKNLKTACPFVNPDNNGNNKKENRDITYKNDQLSNDQFQNKTTLNDSKFSINDYVAYGLIILFFIFLITIILYVKRNHNSSISHGTELPKAKIEQVRQLSAVMDERKSVNIYESEAVYEEIILDANKPYQKCENMEIDDFYVKTSESEKIEEQEFYTSVYKST